jgi:hypothetical protein
VVAVTIVGVGVYMIYVRMRPYLHGTGCEAHTTTGVVPLDPDQAVNAATISAVADRRRLPEQAVVIAYATAMQESHLENLGGGDLDSVGLFQQRPSQGWGPAAKLQNPAYATGRFFDALVKVKDYVDLPIEEAAQKVQRSADGSAYAEHSDEAKILATAFTGRQDAAVRCWYPPDQEKKESRAPAAVTSMLHASGGHASGTQIPVTTARSGWAVASWMVSNAQDYGIREIRFAGKHWQSNSGHDGWTHDGSASPDRVVVR